MYLIVRPGQSCCGFKWRRQLCGGRSQQLYFPDKGGLQQRKIPLACGTGLFEIEVIGKIICCQVERIACFGEICLVDRQLASQGIEVCQGEDDQCEVTYFRESLLYFGISAVNLVKNS